MTELNSLQNQTIKNNFMFGAVMLDEENCRLLLERVLEIPIEKVEVSREKSIVYHPEFKGVRLDAYAKDMTGRRFNVEMQIVREPSPGKRSRYYHSQIDMELLLKGMEYEKLPDSYVIFICDYDPFHAGKYRYVFHNICMEDDNVELRDGSWTIFLNTHGNNEDEISEELLAFLQFVKADKEQSQQNYNDAFVSRLQKSIQDIKQSREMEARYMLLEELLKRQYKTGKEEGKIEGKIEFILDVLEDVGIVSDQLRSEIVNQKDVVILAKWMKLASRTDSIEQFVKEMNL